MKVAINIGPSGSGKSTASLKEIEKIPTGIIHSTDHYPTLYRDDGSLDFSKLSKAHAWNFEKFIYSLIARRELVIVDNTNTSDVEIAPYYLGAQAFGYEVELRRFNASVEVCISRATHGAPEGVIRGQYERAHSLKLPPWYPAIVEMP